MHYTENEVTTIIRIDDIIVEFEGHVCQQLVLYINATYGYTLYFAYRRLVPLFLRGRLHIGASQQDLYNYRFVDFVDRIYIIELEIKNNANIYFCFIS